MNLRLHRKLQSCPSVQQIRFRKQQVLYSKKLTPKQKGLFLRNRLFRSAETQRRFSRSFLYRQTAMCLNAGGSQLCMSRLGNSSFWIFQNPTLVPGTLKVRRFKRLFSQSHSAAKILSVWLNRPGQSMLYSLYRTLVYSSKACSWGLVCALETSFSFGILKSGLISSLAQGNLMAKQGRVISNFEMNKHPVRSQTRWNLPGDFLSADPSLVLSALQPFHAKALKSLKV